MAAEFGQDLADVAAVRTEGAEALRGRVTEYHPQRARFSKDPVVVDLPVAGEGGAVLAHRGDPVGPAAERPGAQPGHLGGLGAGQVRAHGGDDLDRRAARSAAPVGEPGKGEHPGRT